MALITREYFNKLPLGLTKQMEPFMEAVEAFIDTASEQVEVYCERKFTLQTHVQTLRGTGHNTLMLEQYPLSAVASITYDDDYAGTYTVPTANVRVMKEGIVEFKYPVTNGPWRRDRIYTVTYIAGYDPIPGPIQHATALWVTDLMRPSFAGPSAERPSELVPFTESTITRLLDNYMRRRIG